MTEEERRDDARDLGMALAWGARIMNEPHAASLAARQSLPFLEAAVRDRPDDVLAGESLGLVLGILDRPQEALRAFEGVLRVEPGREWTLRSSGRLLARLERPDLARAAFQKTIAVNPWSSDYHLALARNCSRIGDWPAAIAACREALRLNPELFDARSLLVQCYLWSNQPDKAEAEFQILLRFYPASREIWQRWYAQEKQKGPDGAALPANRGP
jgi:tetratricopeptide (TPR) repeat protein